MPVLNFHYKKEMLYIYIDIYDTHTHTYIYNVAYGAYKIFTYTYIMINELQLKAINRYNDI
jgi:hypothetical protein